MPTGAIVRVNKHGPDAVVSGLNFPTGMTVGHDSAFYVSNQGFGFPAGDRPNPYASDSEPCGDHRAGLPVRWSPNRRAGGHPDRLR